MLPAAEGASYCLSQHPSVRPGGQLAWLARARLAVDKLARGGFA